jgi:hypothetical protein
MADEVIPPGPGGFRAATDRLGAACLWKHGGRDPADGLDCHGLVCWAYAFMGHPLPELVAERYQPGDALLKETFQRIAEVYGRRFDDVTRDLARGSWQDGDVWVIRSSPGGWQLGLVAGGQFVFMRETVCRIAAWRVAPIARKSFRLRV